jgi:YHS domain-containing protein
MTPPRRQRKSRLIRMPWHLGPAAVQASVLVSMLVSMLDLGVPFVLPVSAATTERVVHDPHTGLAISGIDPVAYFTDGAPLFGRADYEYRYAGVVWRFRNEGNQAAFIANPDVYMPRYGGYDPVAVGRAVAVPGNPLLWAVVGERLYLFYNEEARARFVANPDEAILLADNKWPAVVGALSR